MLTCLRISLLCIECSDGPAKQAEKKCYEGWLESERDKHQSELDYMDKLRGKLGSSFAGGGSAGGGHKRKRQVDAHVLALLREWKLEDESERLAENGVCKVEDLEFMKVEDVQKFGFRLKFRGLLQHVTMQKKKRLVSEVGCQSDDDDGGVAEVGCQSDDGGGGGGVAEVGCQSDDDDGGYLRSPSPEREFQQPASNYKGRSYSPLPPARCQRDVRTQSYDPAGGRPVSSAGNTPGF